MKSHPLAGTGRVLLQICVCFLFASSGYLFWMYRLLEQLLPTAVDFSTDVAAYLCQAAGVTVFVLAVRRRPTLAGKGPFALSLGADLALTLLALVVPGPVLTLITGLAMNLLHGVVAGYYLDRLASRVPWQRRGLVFGLGYGVASLASWGVSLLCGGTPLRLFPALVVCVLLAGAALVLALREPPLPSPEAVSPSPASGTSGLVLLAAGSVVLLSLVKNLGFNFPAADISQGIDLEFSRLFYAVGLLAAGLVSDRSRKWGALCCLASLGVPFFMAAVSASLQASLLLWILGYLLFGFFTVFRVLLFTDLSQQSPSRPWLAAGGLLFGRLGDALGAGGCLLLGENPPALLAVTAVLFAGTVLFFLRFYQRMYHAPVRESLPPEEALAAFARQHALTAREKEVLSLILAGKTTPEMAEGLFISERTVKYHVHNLLGKTGCENRTALTALFRSGQP